MNITEEIGGLEQSMKKKNNQTVEQVTVEEEVIIEKPVELNLDEEEVEEVAPKKRFHLFGRKHENGGARTARFEANTLSTSAKHSMLTRIISAIIGLAILVPAIFLGDLIYFALMTVFLGFACWEILGCANKRTFLIFIIYFALVAAFTYWPIFKTLIVKGLGPEFKIDTYFQSLYIPVIVVVLAIFLLFALTVLYKDFTVQDAAFLIAMLILIGLGFQCLCFLRYFPNSSFGSPGGTWVFTIDNTVKPSLLICFVLVSTFMTDTGAYFVGIFFGKNKMNERISPKKTWEGFVGGIIISFLLSASLGLICAACGYPILKRVDLEHWYFILILSFFIPLFATLGDFVFSSIKRYWGIKDYGKLIPGHGGVLDRLDSVFFAAIISSIIVFMFSCFEDIDTFEKLAKALESFLV